MKTRTRGSRFGLVGRAGAVRLAGSLLFAVVAVPALATPVGAAGCGHCDDDGDLLSNAREYGVYGTDLADPDTDGDGLGDGEEVDAFFTNPLAYDTDGDGVGDGAEVFTHRTDPLLPDGAATEPGGWDQDGAGIGDHDEALVDGTDPLRADTAGDGFADNLELFVAPYTDPLNPFDF